MSSFRLVLYRCGNVCLLADDLRIFSDLTHLHFLQLDGWLNFVNEIKVIEDGGEGLSRVEKLRDLGLYVLSLLPLDLTLTEGTLMTTTALSPP